MTGSTETPAGGQQRRPRLRLTLSALPGRYALPARPAAGPPAVQDAYRQSQYLLGDDLALFERAMNLQLRIVSENTKVRSPEAKALAAFWSRVFSHLADTCTLVTSGSYASCPPLLRTACDCIAAERSLVRDGFAEYTEWLARAVTQSRENAALAFDLGRYRAGSALAEDPRLGALYRLLTDLSMPHFGSTAFLTAPDSNLQRLSLAFADGAFHLGWTELLCGWLLSLAEAQASVVIASGAFTISEDARAEQEAIGRETALTRENRRRCRVDEVDGRFLFHNFRRSPAGAPRRVLL